MYSVNLSKLLFVTTMTISIATMSCGLISSSSLVRTTPGESGPASEEENLILDSIVPTITTQILPNQPILDPHLDNRNTSKHHEKDQSVTRQSTAYDDPAFYEKTSVQIHGSTLSEMRGPPDTSLGIVSPRVTAATMLGEEINLIQPGAYNLIIFLAHWCPHCRTEVRLLSPYLNDNIPVKNLTITSVATWINPNMDNYPPHNWLLNENWPVQVLADNKTSDISSAFGVTGVPAFILLDENGVVIARKSGRLGVSSLAELVDKLDPESPTIPSTTNDLLSKR